MATSTHQFTQLQWVRKIIGSWIKVNSCLPFDTACVGVCWAAVLVREGWLWWLLLLGEQAALEWAVGWSKCVQAPHKFPGRGSPGHQIYQESYSSQEALLYWPCIPYFTCLLPCPHVCSDWCSLPCPQWAVLLEMQLSALSPHLEGFKPHRLWNTGVMRAVPRGQYVGMMHLE